MSPVTDAGVGIKEGIQRHITKLGLLNPFRIPDQDIDSRLDELRCRSNLLRSRNSSANLRLVRSICISAAEQNGKKSDSSVTNQGGLHSSFHGKSKRGNSLQGETASAPSDETLAARHVCRVKLTCPAIDRHIATRSSDARCV
ncbi:hypothetical protein [Bradyrhizobium erythrophlei]|uniref:hypothetical protein n=1 Tax=Bradyrhizobium erythrophlei TaxID=1437360 RepID=UPI00155F7684|nr:hypothetical protein [Bradyrhizobium erythrophlei]